MAGWEDRVPGAYPQGIGTILVRLDPRGTHLSPGGGYHPIVSQAAPVTDVSVYPRLKIPAGIRVPPEAELATSDDVLNYL